MKIQSPSLTARRVLAAVVPLAIAGAAVTAVPAGAAPTTGPDPAGNNGTVKVTTYEKDGLSPSSCTFDVEWYGFDEGPNIVSTIEFSEQAPTRGAGLSVTGDKQVFVGGDPATGAGTDTGLDGVETYTYSAAVADAGSAHGYHVKARVHTPGSQGADTKYKVFWLEPCVSAPPPAES